jgi:hypothetical protein
VTNYFVTLKAIVLIGWNELISGYVGVIACKKSGVKQFKL